MTRIGEFPVLDGLEHKSILMIVAVVMFRRNPDQADPGTWPKPRKLRQGASEAPKLPARRRPTAKCAAREQAFLEMKIAHRALDRQRHREMAGESRTICEPS